MSAIFIAYFLMSTAAMAEARGSYFTAFNVLGDSSVDCGENTLFYPFLHRNLSLVPCDGSDSSLLPHLLGKKMGIAHIPPFYGQNGTIEGLLHGVNYGSAKATIINPSSENHQSLNQQLRQVFDTFQLLELKLGQKHAKNFIKSSVFYLSFGKDDYIDLFLGNFSGAMYMYSGQEFAQILVDQLVRVIKNLYDANVRKIICMGILPLGCSPHTVLEWYNSTTADDNGSGCVEEINELILQYNIILSEQIVELNANLSGIRVIFCDVYQGIMEIISNPRDYGFNDVHSACCGLGLYGATIGCLSEEMACDDVSSHVWWDLYNPTRAVNSLLVKTAWSGYPLYSICSPLPIRDFLYT